MRSVVALVLGLSVLPSSPLSSQRAVPRPTPAPGRAAVARAESPVPFKVGETLSWDVSWSLFPVTAGTAVATVREKKPSFNSTAYYIVAEGRPVPLVAALHTLYYKMDTLLDSVGLLSQRGSLYSEEGSDRRTSTTRFDRAMRRAFFEQKADTTVAADFAVPQQTQDGLAAFYALRGRALKAGDRVTIPVADSGVLYTTQVDVGPLETVSVPFGRASAWKLKIGITDATNQPVWRDIALWISNDARRLPVKMQAELPVGAFVLELRSAR